MKESIEEITEDTAEIPISGKKRIFVKFIIVVMAMCACMIAFLLLFQVRKVKVEGNKYLTDQEVADWLIDDELSSNMFYLLGKFHFSDYKLLPAMESASIRMENPWTVRIKVKEKQVVGYIVVGDEFVYFDSDGVVLEKSREWWDDVPGIEGLNVTEVSLFQELPVGEENLKIFNKLLDMSATLEKYQLKPDRIVIGNVEIHLYFGGVCVNLGEENLKDRIAQITPILEKLGGQGGTLHLETYTDSSTTIRFEKDVLPD